MRNEKLKRLEHVARLYYEQNQTQAEIAQALNVSRPLISRMLDEARQAGIVEIRIHSQSPHDSPALDRARQVYSLAGGHLVPDGRDDSATNQALGRAAFSLVEDLGGGHVGLGWGHIIGTMVSILENQPPAQTSITNVCPMVGNSNVSIRNYHSNENTRIVAQQTMATAHYLYTPALAETRQELDLLTQTEQYRAVLREWEKLDIALVNIGDHPSTPDFASGARFGNLLTKQRAVGRFIAYYFNVEGGFIHSDHDYIIQIPLEVLSRCPHVVGICSANVGAKALRGALSTGLLTHLVAREALMSDVMGI